jgi:O-6-methylguanine DNA methyltransferase
MTAQSHAENKMKSSTRYRSPAQLVAEACSANPVAVIVPCHRVIRSDGSIGGYRWGTHRKKALLAREQASAS